MGSTLKCPKCGSTSVFQEIAVMAKYRLNAKGKNKVFDVNTYDRSEVYESCGCNKCGWTGNFCDLDENISKIN